MASLNEVAKDLRSAYIDRTARSARDVPSCKDILDLISRVQAHRNQSRKGPLYLASCVGFLRSAYREVNQRQREYWLVSALTAFREEQAHEA